VFAQRFSLVRLLGIKIIITWVGFSRNFKVFEKTNKKDIKKMPINIFPFPRKPHNQPLQIAF
jgi:hypothetical protein